MTVSFFLNALGLGIGLAMDAFSVSLANGLYYPDMSNLKRVEIAGTFAFFQFVMPLTGWFCIHTIFNLFQTLQIIIPWVGILLLIYIGSHMILESIKDNNSQEKSSLNLKALLIQGIATSIDALSVGFTIADLNIFPAFIESLIIGLITFIICELGLVIGNRVGAKFQNKAGILGGTVLILIALEILIEQVL